MISGKVVSRAFFQNQTVCSARRKKMENILISGFTGSVFNIMVI
jgi:hypothetical protein